jgi:hypothetical protein
MRLTVGPVHQRDKGEGRRARDASWADPHAREREGKTGCSARRPKTRRERGRRKQAGAVQASR